MPHIEYLTHALKLAKIGKGFCSPNPSVGAIIIDGNGSVLSEGYHNGPGTFHAEVDAFKKLTHIPKDATLYVTLEPCCHVGRTPPCTDAIIASGLKKVFYAFKDPNPIVAGKGEEKLRAAGIHCEHIAIPEINHFYESYAHWHKTKLPFITAKIAMSLDGVIASSDSKPIKITGETINQFTHQSRKSSDAILTTATTIIADNPQFNARIHNEVFTKPLYVLDRELKLPLNAKIFSTTKSITLFHSNMIDAEKITRMSQAHIRCIPISLSENQLNLTEVIQKIGEDGIQDLWIEAGGKCFSAFLNQNLLNKAFVYIAPKILGEGLMAFQYNKYSHQNIEFEKMGSDILCTLKL